MRMLPYYDIVEYTIVINHSKPKIFKLYFRAKPDGTASMYSYVAYTYSGIIQVLKKLPFFPPFCSLFLISEN